MRERRLMCIDENNYIFWFTCIHFAFFVTTNQYVSHLPHLTCNGESLVILGEREKKNRRRDHRKKRWINNAHDAYSNRCACTYFLLMIDEKRRRLFIVCIMRNRGDAYVEPRWISLFSLDSGYIFKYLAFKNNMNHETQLPMECSLISSLILGWVITTATPWKRST